MIQAAIFDLDGTLLNSMDYWLHVGELYLQKLDIKPESNLGVKLFSLTFTDGAKYLKETYNLTFSIPQICNDINKLLSNLYKNTIELKPFAKEFLQKLKESKTKIALCTNTPKKLFEPALHRLNIYDCFDFLVTTEETCMTKDNKEIFFYVAELLQSKANQTWVFEDALYSIKTAKLAGFNTVGILDNSSKKDKEQIIKYSNRFYTDYKTALEDF